MNSISDKEIDEIYERIDEIRGVFIGCDNPKTARNWHNQWYADGRERQVREVHRLATEAIDRLDEILKRHGRDGVSTGDL